MDLQELGALLRQTREDKGLSLDEIASKIKLPARAIKFLEEGHITDLPHPVYARGFMKSYAEILGIDREEIIEHLQKAFPMDGEDDTPEPGPVGRLTVDADSGSGRMLVFFVLFLSISLIIGGGWFFYSKYADSSVESIKGLYSSIFSGKDSGTGQKPEFALPENSGISEQGTSATGAAGVGAEQSGQQAAERTFFAPAAPSTVAEEREPVAMQAIEVTAKRGARIEFTADEGETRGFNLSKNQVARLEFRHNLNVKLLTPANIKIRYNEENYVFDVPLGGGPKVLDFPPPIVLTP